MLDVRTLPDAAVPDAAPSPTHTTIRREDYRPPEWRVPEIELRFDLGLEKTRVQSKLLVERNGSHDNAIRLDGDGLVPVGVWVDGEKINDWTMDHGALVIPLPG